MVLLEIAYEMMGKVEFYGLESEFRYKYGDFKVIKEKIENGDNFREVDSVSIIKICAEILENIL